VSALTTAAADARGLGHRLLLNVFFVSLAFFRVSCSLAELGVRAESPESPEKRGENVYIECFFKISYFVFYIFMELRKLRISLLISAQ
jgi:hypothetical protein